MLRVDIQKQLGEFSLAAAFASEGRVTGLFGASGSGKTSLINTIAGLVRPDRGSIVIDGVARAAMTVPEAMAAGIAFVHQELNLFDNLDVAGNVFAGREPRGRLGLIDRARLRAEVVPILARLGAGFGPDAPVAGLSLADMDLIELNEAFAAQGLAVLRELGVDTDRPGAAHNRAMAGNDALREFLRSRRARLSSPKTR